MATVRQYGTRLFAVERAICSRMGVKLDGSDKQLRAVVKSLLIIVAVIIKVTVDKGLVTDAEWESAFALAESDTSYPDESIEPPG